MGLTQKQADVQVIVPARNEQDCIGACVESLVRQQGIDFQITVVDDGSTDQTLAIAESFPGVHVIRAFEAVNGATGKCNALVCGARQANAEWLLFTDADTVHYPGSLAAAVKEAQERGVDLLSYSPEQEVVSWSEQILMPVVFAELARQYPPARVNDPADPVAAANGQYILVRRTTYEELGGHPAVASKVLEDVELARLFKSVGRNIWFRQGAGLVKTRMYRTFSSLVEGWTKNLALLFPNPIRLAAIRAVEFFTIVLTVCGYADLLILPHGQSTEMDVLLILGTIIYLNFVRRTLVAHFPWKANALAIFGLPLFSFLLLRSYFHTRVRGTVRWKGRVYTRSETHAGSSSSIKVRD